MPLFFWLANNRNLVSEEELASLLFCLVAGFSESAALIKFCKKLKCASSIFHLEESTSTHTHSIHLFVCSSSFLSFFLFLSHLFLFLAQFKYEGPGGIPVTSAGKIDFRKSRKPMSIRKIKRIRRRKRRWTIEINCEEKEEKTPQCLLCVCVCLCVCLCRKVEKY